MTSTRRETEAEAGTAVGENAIGHIGARRARRRVFRPGKRLAFPFRFNDVRRNAVLTRSVTPSENRGKRARNPGRFFAAREQKAAVTRRMDGSVSPDCNNLGKGACLSKGFLVQ
jgi:hypothetical protein